MVNVPSGSERLMYSLADPLHILYAHGNFKAGSILYHGLEAGGADITDTKVDLTSIQVIIVCIFMFSSKTSNSLKRNSYFHTTFEQLIVFRRVYYLKKNLKTFT